MPIFRIGPAPNAVSCTLDPTRLPAGQIHCNPVIRTKDASLRATGSPAVLKDLMDARFEAQRSGITIDGTISGKTIAVRRVTFARRRTAPVVATRPVSRPPAAVARRRLERMESARARVEGEVLWQTVIDGITIKLLAITPSGRI